MESTGHPDPLRSPETQQNTGRVWAERFALGSKSVCLMGSQVCDEQATFKLSRAACQCESFPSSSRGRQQEGWLAPARLLSLGGRLAQEPCMHGCYTQDVAEHRGHGVPKPSQCRQDPSQLQSRQLGISTRKMVT